MNGDATFQLTLDKDELLTLRRLLSIQRDRQVQVFGERRVLGTSLRTLTEKTVELLDGRENAPTTLDPDPTNWRPACNGAEKPFLTRGGLKVQYLFQPSTMRHAYINVDTDTMLTDDEADAAMRGAR